MANEILIGAAAAGSVITLILAVSAVGVPRWIDYSTTSSLGTMHTYRGFWQVCVELNNNIACKELQHADKKDFEAATVVMMVFGIVAILVAFINMIVYPGKENARRRAAVASVVAALVEPWWVYCESIVRSVLIKRYQGFWRGCTDTNGNITCSEIHGDDWNDWEKVTLAMMFLGIFLTVISFIMSIAPPRLRKVKMAGAGINILAGVLFLVGGSVFGAKGKGKKICSNPYLGSCFILGVLCLILSFINACVFAAATAIQSNRRSSVSIDQQILDVDVS